MRDPVLMIDAHTNREEVLQAYLSFCMVWGFVPAANAVSRHDPA